uniref:Transcriptional adapter n=1 Tax=Strigamia maritima TaxID=126957 RepID=T1IYY3_STRMM
MFTIFQASNAWKATEEILLLDAIEQYGFGNWEDVARHIETRTSEEAREHYHNMYILGNMGKRTWPNEIRVKPRDHTCPEGGPLSPGLSVKLLPLELSVQEQQELGYMPNRDDFEREFDNEAESLISNLVVNNEDEEIDLALKLAHVDMYSKRVKERLRRKKVARDYTLVSQFFSWANKQKSQNSKKKLSKEEKEFQEKIRTFAQFQAPQEREQLFEMIQREKELKIRVRELMRFRKNGITKLDVDCEEFESARYKREKKKENKKKSVSLKMLSFISLPIMQGNSSSSHRRSSLMSKKQEEKGVDISQDDVGADDVKEDAKDFDISVFPGFDMLSDRERKLCTSMGLKPAKYTSLKAVLIKDHLQRRKGIPTKPCYPAGLEKAHRRKIINFLMNSGWITAC